MSEVDLPERRRVLLLHPGLISVGATLLIAGLVSDIVYWRTLLFQYNNMSQWLVAGGLVFALLAAVAFVIDLALRRVGHVAWPRFAALAVVAVLGIINAFVHSRDAYSAVVPQGITLSLITTIILLAVGLTGGWSLVVRTPSAFAAHRESPPMSRILRFSLLAATAALTLAACDDKAGDPRDQYGSDPKLPAPQSYLLPPMKVMPARGWNAGETPTAAEGLRVVALATGFMHPRTVFPLPNGDILVVESNGSGGPVYRPKDYIEGKIKGLAGTGAPAGQRIILLRPPSGDGGEMQRSVYIDHLNAPFGVALVDNNLYVADTDAVLRFPYDPAQTVIKEPGAKVTDLPAQAPNHHWTKAMTASPDGSKLYVGVGSNSNITENGIGAEQDRAAIWEIDRQTGVKRMYAGGIRNPTGVAFEPTTKHLWAIANERDEIGPDLVPDYLTSVQENAFYGWPYSYWGQHVDVRVQPQRPDMVAKAIRPDYGLSSHVAPLGLAFTQTNSLPTQFQNGVFIGEHGSWDRDPPAGYKVVFVKFQDGRPVGTPQDVLTDFLSKDGKNTRGRPVGVALDRSGALLVADDVGNTVWRVTSAQSASAEPAR